MKQKFTITYQRDVIDTIEANDLDAAARMACAAVINLHAQHPEYGARVLSIYRVDEPPSTVQAT